MHSYGVRDVESLLGLTRGAIRALITAGFVTPERGPRNAWRFSFQDLIVLRTAQALVAANVPQRRINKSLKELRRQLPASMPLSGLSIGAVGDRVVVREGGGRWQAESGQYLLEFDVKAGADSQKPGRIPGFPPGGEMGSAPGTEAQAWYQTAVALEREDAEGAIKAYDKVIALEPNHVDACINRALLLHEGRRFADAVRAYRDALQACGNDAVLLFNFGVLLEDVEREAEAIKAYEAALRGDAAMADAHYNVALLYEKSGKRQEAIRHMSQYRRLVAGQKK